MSKFKSKKITFVLIAERDANFFIPVAIKMREMGFKVNFLLFYEPSLKKIINKNFEAFIFSNYVKNTPPSAKEIDRIQVQYNLNIQDLVRHERMSFGLNSDIHLINKAFCYIQAMESWLHENKTDFIIQELGGFIAPLSLYYVALRNRITHFFIEPMFFNGMICFIKNDINFKLKNEGIKKISLNNVTSYLNAFKTMPQILIPKKDKHHFNYSVFAKVLNFSNFKKILLKLYYKYLTGQKQEYDAISNYIYRSLRSVLNSFLLKIFYYNPDFKFSHIKYIYFPLHVPIDFALTVRSPEFLDQISVVKKISESIPKNYELWIKEHPASIGTYSPIEIFRLTKLANIKIISPTFSSFDLIKNASSIVTINSKVGAEAIIFGKQVYCLGEVFYKDSNLCQKVKTIDDLKKMLKNKRVKNSSLSKNYQKSIYMFFARVFQSSSLGEMYINDANNIKLFSKSLKKALSN